MKIVILAVATVLGAVSLAHAGSAQEALSQCVAEKASEEERDTFARWSFVLWSAHPAVRDFVSIPESERDMAALETARTVERLFLIKCREQSIAAYREGGFGVLGNGILRLAAQMQAEMQADINASPAMRSEIDRFVNMLDEDTFKSVLE